MIAELLLDAARDIERAVLAGHQIWGDGQALDRGWPAMLAWNLALGGMCEAAGNARMGWLP